MKDYKVLTIGQCFQYQVQSYLPNFFRNIDCKGNSYKLDFMYASGSSSMFFNLILDRTYDEAYKIYDLTKTEDNQGVEIKHIIRQQEYDYTNDLLNFHYNTDISIRDYVRGKHYDCFATISNLSHKMYNINKYNKAIDTSISFLKSIKKICSDPKMVVSIPPFKYDRIDKIGGIQQYAKLHQLYINRIYESGVVDVIIRHDLIIEDILKIINKSGLNCTKDGRHIKKGILFYAMTYLFYKVVFEEPTEVCADNLILYNSLINACNSSVEPDLLITKELAQKIIDITKENNYIISVNK